jgi:hypothetical protein
LPKIYSATSRQRLEEALESLTEALNSLSLDDIYPHINDVDDARATMMVIERTEKGGGGSWM